MGGIDDAIEEMRLGDLEGATKMAPIPYAKSRGIYPQKIYAAIRNGKLESHHCDCGRTVIVVAEADKLFGKGEEDGPRVYGSDGEGGQGEPD